MINKIKLNVLEKIKLMYEHKEEYDDLTMKMCMDLVISKLGEIIEYIEDLEKKEEWGNAEKKGYNKPICSNCMKSIKDRYNFKLSENQFLCEECMP